MTTRMGSRTHGRGSRFAELRRSGVSQTRAFSGSTDARPSHPNPGSHLWGQLTAGTRSVRSRERREPRTRDYARSPITIDASRAVPPRSVLSTMVSPALRPARRSSRSSDEDTGWPSTARIRSPTLTPADSAGPDAGDSDDEQRPLAPVGALRLGQFDRLHRDADVAAPRRAGDQQLRRGVPRDRCRDDDAVAANLRRGGDAEQRSRRAEDGAAGKAVVERRGDADHPLQLTPASGAQRAADDGDDAGAGGDDVAPGSRERERDFSGPRGVAWRPRAA